jgi:hypothetical protein
LDIPGTDVVNTTSPFYYMPGLTKVQSGTDEEGDLLLEPGPTGVDYERIYRLSKNDVLFEDYLRIVHEYTSRQLRYRSDALNAFFGITKLISATQFASDFIYGLPERYFDQSLLWRRRGPSNIGFPSDTTLPRWSWASGDGPILYIVSKLALGLWWIGGSETGAVAFEGSTSRRVRSEIGMM